MQILKIMHLGVDAEVGYGKFELYRIVNINGKEVTKKCETYLI